MTEERKKEMCQCRSCNKVFHQDEIKRGLKELLEIQIDNELQCPYCGSRKFGLIEYIDETSIDGVYKTYSFLRKTQ